jgi:pimeloyl-ACP methyl ester carboxylesterase
VLPDGRALGYAEVGDPNGAPVVYCHGTPSSRLDALALADAARAAGVRLLAPDRPGIGLSGPRPPWRVGDWPADAAALADAVGIERFGVLGWSGGGPYALACAWALRDRIEATVVVAGPAPPGAVPVGSPSPRRSPRTLALTGADRALEVLARRAPPLAQALLAPAALTAGRWPGLARRALQLDLPAADREALRAATPDFRDMSFFREAFRQGTRGAVLDYRALGSPWGFRPEDVAAPVTLWQGEDDRIVPPSHAEYLATRLPRAKLERLPGEGHLILISHAGEILRSAASRR